MAYYIMPRYGQNLEKLHQKAGGLFNKNTVVFLGIKLLDLLEELH